MDSLEQDSDVNKLPNSVATCERGKILSKRSTTLVQPPTGFLLPLLMHCSNTQKSSEQQMERDGARPTSPSPSVPHAGGLANPLASTSQLAVQFNPIDRPPSALPIRHARKGGRKYAPYPNPSTPPAFKPSLEQQLVPGDEPGSNDSMNLPAPRAAAPHHYRLIQGRSNPQPPPVAQGSSMGDAAFLHSNLGVPAALSRNSPSVPDNPNNRLPTPTPTTTTLQGATNMFCIPHPLTHLAQGPPIGQLPPAPAITQISGSHGARPDPSCRLIEPPKDDPRSGQPTNRSASNVVPRAESASMSLFEGASNFTINNSTMNNAGRDVNIYGSVRISQL